MSIKVLHTEWMDAKGGQTKRVLNDLFLTKEMGFEPVLACKRESFLYDEAQKHGIKTYAVEFKHPAELRSYYKIYKITQKEQIDIIHSHSSKDSNFAIIIGKLLGKKVIRSRHTTLSKRPSLFYKFVDKIIVTGDELVKEFLKYGYDKKLLISIGSYPDKKIFDISKYSKKERSKIIIGTLIGLKCSKRPGILVELAKDLHNDYPNIQFLLAGDSKKEEMENLNANIKNLKLENFIEYIGYVEEPAKFLSNIDIYICPSKKEGLPQAIMQSMMMQKAVVSTNVGSIKQLNKDNNILLSGKNDYQNMKENLIFLIEHKDIRDKMGKKSREIMLKEFSNNIALNLLKQTYLEVLNS